MKNSIILILFFCAHCSIAQIPESPRSQKAIQKYSGIVQKEFKNKGCASHPPLFFRIFKYTQELEVWARDTLDNYILYKTFPICYFSGGLGTKTKQGDGKSPEGFYVLKANQMNPWSSYHLSINIGYPNVLERQKGYTGSHIMIHGDCVSIGCYAIGNDAIEHIWTLLYYSFNKYSNVPLHIFPFKMTSQNMKLLYEQSMFDFWQNLKEGYDFFENKKNIPTVKVSGSKYSYFND